MVLADPAGSILADYIRHGTLGQAGSWLVEGIGEDFIPPIADLGRVTEAYSITDAESFATARELLRMEGILAGSSAGTLVAAALRYCRTRTTPERVVTFICDSGNKYLSKMFNDQWMHDQGFERPPDTGDLRDLVSRRHDAGAVITAAPDDTLLVAFGRMKLHDVSQLPVLDGERVVGLVDEEDLLSAVIADPQAFGHPVSGVMSTALRTVSPGETLDQVRALLGQGLVPIVMDGARFVGLITRSDVLNALRRRVRH
jgi:cystathionine beta-synthase